MGFVSQCFVGHRWHVVSSFDNARLVTPLQGSGMCVLFTVGQAPRLGLGHPPGRANAGTLSRHGGMAVGTLAVPIGMGLVRGGVSLVKDGDRGRRWSARGA